MALQQAETREVPVGPPVRPRGILANAAPAPDGWEAGGIQFSNTCPSIEMQDKCITFDARDVAQPGSHRFLAFTIQQSSGCSTFGRDTRQAEAREALDSATDYALGKAIVDGTFLVDSPSLADATALGDFATAKLALARLESRASIEGQGQMYVIHASPSAAIFLAAENLLTDAGVTPSGAQVIVSAGYETEDGDLQLWATGRVFAAVGSITTRDAVHRRMNEREAWAERDAVIGFNSCINLTATITA